MQISCINIIATTLLTANPLFENYQTIVFDNSEGFEVRHLKINVDVMTAIDSLNKNIVFKETMNEGTVRLCSNGLLHQVLAKAFEFGSRAEQVDYGVLTQEKSFYSKMCLREIVHRSKENEPYRLSKLGSMDSFCEPEILSFFVASSLVKLVGEYSCFAPERPPNYKPKVGEHYDSYRDANTIPTVIADVPFNNPLQLRRYLGLSITKGGVSYRLYLMGSFLQVVVVAKKGNYIHPCFKLKQKGYYIWLPTGPCKQRPNLSGRMGLFTWNKSPMRICARVQSVDAVKLRKSLK